MENVNQSLIFQMFYNLINNAIKFNKPQGSIIIEDRYLKNGQYEILVRDTGVGIPADQLPFIFNRFRKINLPENVGYGLGLAIVKSIAVYHNITISVRSEIKEGTTFIIQFPNT